MIGLSLLLSLAGACDEAVSPSELKTATAEATLSFLGADLGGYEQARDRAWTLLPCVDGVVAESQVMALHQLAALDGFYKRDEALRDGALRALSTVDGYDLPSAFGSKHPLTKAWQQTLETPASASGELPIPEGILLVDGRISLDWPAEQTVFVQYMGDAGDVEWSQLFGPGQAPPTYTVGTQMDREQYLAREVIRHRRPTELVVTSGSLILGGAALFAASRLTRGRFVDNTTPADKLEPLRAQHNGLVLGAGAAVGVGAALGVTAAVVW